MKPNKSIDYDKIRTLIQRIAGTYGKANVKLFDAIVESVNIDERTCVVNSDDNSLDGLTVRFMIDVSDGDMSVPQKDSCVTVAMTDFTEPYIVKATWLDEKLFVVGNQSFDIKKDKQIFNDGKFGGLATVKNSLESNGGLLKRYNLLEEDINKLKGKLDAIKTAAQTAAAITVGWTAGSPLLDTAAAAVLTPFFNAILSNLTPYVTPELEKTTEKMISNPTITHGDKFE